MRIDAITFRTWSLELLQIWGISEYWSVVLQSFFSLILLALVAFLIGSLGKSLVQYVFPKLVKKTKTKWDDRLMDNKFFSLIAYSLFGIIFFCFDSLIASETIRIFTKNITGTYFTILIVLLISRFLNTVYQVYKERNPKEKGNLKIYIQLIKVVVYSFGAIIIISFFANRNLIDILKGLGAMVTILLIVYKDTILGFVAGISLSANKMVEVGDWIVVPNSNADGTVLEIGLNTVKVQNWDMTITTIPPYKLTSEAFINWKGMEQSGGRRIKRSVFIDIDSIHFLSKEELEYFEKFHYLSEYIKTKKDVLKKESQLQEELYNQRRLTNIGTFKKYIENYLKASELVHPNMTFLVRQLQSTEKGLPIEIYCFSKIKAWADYEEIQADIFDHIFAILKEFDLRVYQSVSASSVESFFTENKKTS